MPDSLSTNSDMILGEMRGQLREVVHTVNNLSSKFDSLTREVMSLATVASEVGKLQAKVEMLEQAKFRQAGVGSVVSFIAKSPAIGWIVGAAISAWAVITGKVHV